MIRFLLDEHVNPVIADHITDGRHVPGALCIRPNVTVGRIIEELYWMWHASWADEYQDRIAFIPF